MWWNAIFWTIGALFVLLLLYMLSFFVRLGRTEKTIERAVELGYKQLDYPPLSPAEQAEVDEFCRRGILKPLNMPDGKGGTRIVYTTTEDPILAELTT